MAILFMDAATNENATGATVVNATTATPPAQKVWESENLTKLKADKKTAFDVLRKIEDTDSQEWLDAQMEVYKIGKQIEAEIANLKKAEADAILAEKRNERVKLLDNYDSAVLALSNLPKNATAEAKNAAGDAVKNSREIIVNELLAKFAGAKPATTATGTATTATGAGRGATGELIKASLLGHIAAGKSNTEAVKATIAEGYTRGTTGAVMTAMKKAGEVAND